MENAMDREAAIRPASLRKLGWGRACDLLFAALAVGAIRRTFHDSLLNDEDFHVYWKAAHLWLQGQNPYAFTAEDQGFVFKYPPWLLPFFIPIGLLSFEGGRIAWYFVELACVAYMIRWCISHGVARRLALFVAFLFWWMIHAHFSAGQFTLVLLAAALSAVPAAGAQADRWGWRTAFLTYLMSAKVFSLYTLAGIHRRFLRLAPWLAGAGLFALTHAVVLAVSMQGTQAGLSPIEALASIYQDFMRAASSGGAELGAIIVRGQGNHGLTALVLRTLRVDSLSFASDMIASGLIALGLGALWIRQSKPLTEAEKWAGWIGLGLIVHPLAWHHSFVLAYPLCALSLSRCARTGNRGLIALSVTGAGFIGILIPQVIGHTLVKPYELAGGKSWGVILSAVALVRAYRTPLRQPERPA